MFESKSVQTESSGTKHLNPKFNFVSKSVQTVKTRKFRNQNI